MSLNDITNEFTNNNRKSRKTFYTKLKLVGCIKMLFGEKI